MRNRWMSVVGIVVLIGGVLAGCSKPEPEAPPTVGTSGQPITPGKLQGPPPPPPTGGMDPNAKPSPGSAQR